MKRTLAKKSREKKPQRGKYLYFYNTASYLRIIDHGSSFDFGDSEIIVQNISREKQTKYSVSYLTRFCKNTLH